MPPEPVLTASQRAKLKDAGADVGEGKKAAIKDTDAAPAKSEAKIKVKS